MMGGWAGRMSFYLKFKWYKTVLWGNLGIIWYRDLQTGDSLSNKSYTLRTLMYKVELKAKSSRLRGQGVGPLSPGLSPLLFLKTQGSEGHGWKAFQSQVPPSAMLLLADDSQILPKCFPRWFISLSDMIACSPPTVFPLTDFLLPLIPVMWKIHHL